MINNNHIKIWTDGSCNVQNGLGGAGVYILDGDKEYSISRGFCNTKVGRMELMAFLLALKSIKNKKRSIRVYSDATYIVHPINKGWLNTWVRNKFRGGIKNKDLWRKIFTEVRKFRDLKVFHIKGHGIDLDNNTIMGNNIADVLASYKNFKVFERDL